MYTRQIARVSIVTTWTSNIRKVNFVTTGLNHFLIVRHLTRRKNATQNLHVIVDGNELQ